MQHASCNALHPAARPAPLRVSTATLSTTPTEKLAVDIRSEIVDQYPHLGHRGWGKLWLCTLRCTSQFLARVLPLFCVLQTLVTSKPGVLSGLKLPPLISFMSVLEVDNPSF